MHYIRSLVLPKDDHVSVHAVVVPGDACSITANLDLEFHAEFLRNTSAESVLRTSKTQDFMNRTKNSHNTSSITADDVSCFV